LAILIIFGLPAQLNGGLQLSEWGINGTFGVEDKGKGFWRCGSTAAVGSINYRPVDSPN
jgi:hypothetical protein